MNIGEPVGLNDSRGTPLKIGDRIVFENEFDVNETDTGIVEWCKALSAVVVRGADSGMIPLSDVNHDSIELLDNISD